jgi:hypothetical protein
MNQVESANGVCVSAVVVACTLQVVKQNDPETGERSLLFEIHYPEIEEGVVLLFLWCHCAPSVVMLTLTSCDADLTSTLTSNRPPAAASLHVGVRAKGGAAQQGLPVRCCERRAPTSLSLHAQR